jgi:glutamate-5-semialdehyde dehydrogenase
MECDGMSVLEMGIKAKACEREALQFSVQQKNEILGKMAENIQQDMKKIIRANQSDVQNAQMNNMKESYMDRLRLDEQRIQDIVRGIQEVIRLEDPIGEVLSMKTQKNGLQIGKQRVPLGVIGIIYESRPNVTVETATLCLKSGNVVILRGGSDAFHSNQCLTNSMRRALEELGHSKDFVQLVQSTDRESAKELMQLNEYVDVLIPRGGQSLIQSVVQHSTIPVIETGTGNCHVYVDDQADLEMAFRIVIDAKTHRVSVCNACESVLIHEKIAQTFLIKLLPALKERGVEIRGCQKTQEIFQDCVLATEEDWGTEYLDYIVSVKVVSNLEEAMVHIHQYGTKHSEAIVTENYHRSRRFLSGVDAAAVYVNASTRFTDGMEFGLGSEIGISTQKLHARGPMGLRELTSTKYVIYGEGQTKGNIE